MKRTIVFSIPAFLAVMLFMQVGCGGSDDPAAPPPEECSIDVTDPRAGYQFLVGEEVTINWDETGEASQVVIQLLKGEHVAGTIGTVDNDGYQRWFAETMGAASGGDFAIRVTAAGETGCSDDTDRFSIIDTEGCALSFTMADTAFLDEGLQYDITWDSNNTTGLVDIELMRQDQRVGFVATNTVDDGHFLWDVDSFHQGTYDFYYLRISEPEVEDCEDTSSYFRINDDNICELWVHNPQPGVVWQVGETRNVSFTALDENTTHVNISLYEGTQLVNHISNNEPVLVTGQEQNVSWVVSDTGSSTPDTTYRIKISDAGDPNCVVWSEYFTIPAAP